MIPALIGAGIVCRLVQYLWDRSFWVDEASLVLNIRNRTAGELLGKLDFHQAAPPLFLLAERGLFRAFGGSELSLRLLPLAAGCVSVVLFAVIARRLLNPWAAIVALALFCFSDRLIWHATEVKQYGLDVLIALVLTVLAVGTRDDREAFMRRLVRVSLAAAVGVWFSYPAALAFGGISVALLPAVLRGCRRGWVLYLAANLAVVVSFSLMLSVVAVQHSQSLADYWVEDFLDWHHPLAAVVWLARHLLSLCNYPVDPLGAVALACAMLGAAWMARSGASRELAMLVNPIGMNLLAAAADRYPFDGARLTVFLAPAVLLLAGGGCQAIWEWVGDRLKWLWVVAAAALVAVAAANSAFHLVVPRARGHLRPVAAFVRDHVQPSDVVYCLQEREFSCYWPVPDSRLHDELPPADEIPGKRFWIVWSYANDRIRHRLDGTLDWAQSFSRQRMDFLGSGGCAYLFEITAAPVPPVPPPDMATHHKMMHASTPEGFVR